jgi:membrane-bound serine protease (ClpP class)
LNKKIIFIISLIFVLIFSSFGFAQNDKRVYIVPINGEINKATTNYVRGVLDDIKDENVDGIIFDIDTYGGLIQEAIEIKDMIISLNIPTISYVNNKAESAGVLLTIASESVAVAPGATIGSAETIPNTEKILSMWRAVLRDTAQYRNRDAEVIQAMADKNIEIDGLTTKGNLVNLTSTEAIEYGIADEVTNNYRDILKDTELESAEIIEIEEGLQIKLAKYISSPYLSSFLLTLAFVGLVFEILTPGFGIGGTISIIGFGLYFGGNILAGNSNWTSLALFVTGLILLVVEGIVPGFGLPGISGIVFVLIGTILAMDSLKLGILSLSAAIIITAAVSIVLIKRGFKSKLFNSVVLNAKHDGDKGYFSSNSMDMYLLKEGMTISELRPSGYIDIDGDRIDALALHGYIPKNVPIKVAKVEGSKIFVRRI